MSEVPEYVGIILEDELLDHLGIPESVIALRKAGFSVDWIGEKEVDIRRCFLFAMNFLHEHGEPADKGVLEYEFGAEFKEPLAPLDYIIEQFRERYRRREAQGVLKVVNRQVNANPTEAVDIAFREFTRIRQETMERKYVVDSDEIGEVIDRYKDRILRRTEVPTFGYPEVDADLTGIDGLVFMIARPKRYKSWQLVTASVYNQYCGNTVSFETLEMPKEEMLDRYACMRAGVSWFKFTKGSLLPEDLDKLRAAKEENESNDVKVHFHHPRVGERSVTHMAMRAEEVGAKVILIDQLKWIEPPRHTEDRWREVEYICEELKELANLVPVFCAAQFNREAANLAEMADLSKIGLSDSIGQTADCLLGIYASKEMLQNNLLQFGVIDSRKYEHARYEMKVDLTKDSSFRILKKLEEW